MSKQLLGQKAPDFSLSSSSGEVVQLSDYDGIWKVLFFYAKDGSPTCKRGCLNFKAQYELFQSLKIINSRLWTIEDDKRLCEKNSDFGEVFIKTSRDIHFLNDKRGNSSEALKYYVESISLEKQGNTIANNHTFLPYSCFFSYGQNWLFCS